MTGVVMAVGCSSAVTPSTTEVGSVSSTVESSSVGTTTTVAGSTTTVGVMGGLVPASDPWVLAEEYHLISPDGEYFGPVGSDGEPLLFGPIEGYGDFSKIDRFDVDNYEVVRLLARCVRDRGFPVSLTQDGPGLSYESVPPEQNQLAYAVEVACKAGLHVRSPEPVSVEQLEKGYAYEVALAACLEDQGYSVSDPPSLDSFIDSQGYWNPYFDLSVPLSDWVPLNRVCPQNPVGGFGAWNPGDPILPMP